MHKIELLLETILVYVNWNQLELGEIFAWNAQIHLQMKTGEDKIYDNIDFYIILIKNKMCSTHFSGRYNIYFFQIILFNAVYCLPASLYVCHLSISLYSWIYSRKICSKYKNYENMPDMAGTILYWV